MKAVVKMSDDELFDELRCVVNLSRNEGRYNSSRGRRLFEEMRRRGWLKPERVRSLARNAGV